jgi:hypothetical protein
MNVLFCCDNYTLGLFRTLTVLKSFYAQKSSSYVGSVFVYTSHMRSLRLLVYLTLFFLMHFNSAFASTSHFDTWSEYHMHKTAILEENDPRILPAALRKGSEPRYRANGAVLCKGPKSTAEHPYDIRHSATLIENGFTLISDAHSFYDEAGQLMPYDGDCIFNVYDGAGNILETSIVTRTIRSSFGVAREQITGKNKSNDWTILTLSTEIKTVMPFKVASRGKKLGVNDKISICSFSHDLKNPHSYGEDAIGYYKPCLQGHIRLDGKDHSNYRNSLVFLHDISTNGMSSGGSVFDDSTVVPTVYGLHTEGTCDNPHGFNPMDCYNVGIFFPDEFYNTLDKELLRTGGSIYKNIPAEEKAPSTIPQNSRGVST